MIKVIYKASKGTILEAMFNHSTNTESVFGVDNHTIEYTSPEDASNDIDRNKKLGLELNSIEASFED